MSRTPGGDHSFGKLFRKELDLRRSSLEARAKSVTLRSLYYRIRARNKGKGVSYAGFGNDLQNYMKRHGIEDYEELGLIPEPRGHLFLDGESVEFTERGIERAKGRYAAVLMVEKENVARTLAPELDRRGILVVAIKGEPTRAHQRFAESETAAGVPVFVLSDFDVGGINVADPLLKRGAQRVELADIFPEESGIDRALIQRDYARFQSPEVAFAGYKGELDALSRLAKKKRVPGYGKLELDPIMERHGPQWLSERLLASLDRRVPPGKPLVALPRTIVPTNIRSILDRLTSAFERLYEAPTRRALDSLGPLNFATFDRKVLEARLAGAVERDVAIPLSRLQKLEGVIEEIEALGR